MRNYACERTLSAQEIYTEGFKVLDAGSDGQLSEQAKALFAHAATRGPAKTVDFAYYILGALAQRRGDVRQALQCYFQGAKNEEPLNCLAFSKLCNSGQGKRSYLKKVIAHKLIYLDPNPYLEYVNRIKKVQAEAAYLLGRMHEKGRNGVASSFAKAAKYYNKSLEFEENNDALYRLALLYVRNGEILQIPENEACNWNVLRNSKVMILLKQLARRNAQSGLPTVEMYEAAIKFPMRELVCYQVQNVHRFYYAAAMAGYKHAKKKLLTYAERKDVGAQYFYGMLLLTEKDEDQAIAYFKQVAIAGYAEAFHKLSELSSKEAMYAVGEVCEAYSQSITPPRWLVNVRPEEHFGYVYSLQLLLFGDNQLDIWEQDDIRNKILAEIAINLAVDFYYRALPDGRAAAAIERLMQLQSPNALMFCSADQPYSPNVADFVDGECLLKEIASTCSPLMSVENREIRKKIEKSKYRTAKLLIVLAKGFCKLSLQNNRISTFAMYRFFNFIRELLKEPLNNDRESFRLVALQSLVDTMRMIILNDELRGLLKIAKDTSVYSELRSENFHRQLPHNLGELQPVTGKIDYKIFALLDCRTISSWLVSRGQAHWFGKFYIDKAYQEAVSALLHLFNQQVGCGSLTREMLQAERRIERESRVLLAQFEQAVAQGKLTAEVALKLKEGFIKKATFIIEEGSAESLRRLLLCSNKQTFCNEIICIAAWIHKLSPEKQIALLAEMATKKPEFGEKYICEKYAQFVAQGLHLQIDEFNLGKMDLETSMAYCILKLNKSIVMNSAACEPQVFSTFIDYPIMTSYRPPIGFSINIRCPEDMRSLIKGYLMDSFSFYVSCGVEAVDWGAVRAGAGNPFDNCAKHIFREMDLISRNRYCKENVFHGYTTDLLIDHLVHCANSADKLITVEKIMHYCERNQLPPNVYYFYENDPQSNTLKLTRIGAAKLLYHFGYLENKID